MPTVRRSARALAAWVALAAAAAAAATPEDREVPPDRGSLRLKDDAFKRLLSELKEGGRTLDQRVEIAGIFAYFREERAVPLLVAIVQSPREPMALKTAALWALGEIGHPRGLPAFQFALMQIYDGKDPEWTQAKGITVEAEDGKARAISLREMCEARLGRLAEPVLLKQHADDNPGLVDLLLAPLATGITPDKPPAEDDPAAGRLRAALISVAAVGDRSPTALRALRDVLTADDNCYPWDFKLIATEALTSILVRRAAELEGLAARDKVAEDIVTALIQAFGVTDVPQVRELGGAALRKTGWADRAAKSLVTVLKTPNLPNRVRYRAIEALACLESKEATDQLVFLMFDPDRNTRWRAAVALGMCGDRRAAPFLRTLLKDDKDAFVRVKAVAALGHLGTAEAVPDLAVAMADPDHRVRRQAALGLGRLGIRQAIPVLVNRGLKDTAPSVRAMSIIALGYITRAEGLKAVPAMLNDSDAGVRRVAVQVLDKFLNPGATRALVAALGDAEPEVRDDAARALAARMQASSREVLELLAQAIAESKGPARLAAIQCVAADYNKMRSAKEPARRRLYDRQLDGPRAPLAAALLAALTDDLPAARAAAGRLLVDHAFPAKNKELLAPVAALAADPNPEARNTGILARNYLNSLR